MACGASAPDTRGSGGRVAVAGSASSAPGGGTVAIAAPVPDAWTLGAQCGRGAATGGVFSPAGGVVGVGVPDARRPGRQYRPVVAPPSASSPAVGAIVFTGASVRSDEAG